MDETKQCIKMADTPEIQKQRWWEFYDNEIGKKTREGNYIEGDVVCADGEIIILGHTPYQPKEYSQYGLEIAMVGYDEGDTTGRIKKLIWLPTQSQLQGMVEDEETKGYAINLLYKFHRFYNTKGDYPSGLVFTSMEQLWLAFVLKEKYNKTWNGSEWITT